MTQQELLEDAFYDTWGAYDGPWALAHWWLTRGEPVKHNPIPSNEYDECLKLLYNKGTGLNEYHSFLNHYAKQTIADWIKWPLSEETGFSKLVKEYLALDKFTFTDMSPVDWDIFDLDAGDLEPTLIFENSFYERLVDLYKDDKEFQDFCKQVDEQWETNSGF